MRIRNAEADAPIGRGALPGHGTPPGRTPGGAGRRATTGPLPRARAAGALALGLLLLLTACGGPSDAPDKNGDTPPTALSGLAGAARHPVPQGTGSRVPYDFNGDGHRDLVLNDLVKPASDSHGDDAGIGIVYGSEDGGLDPSTRALLAARTHAARFGDTLPSAFDAETACDLDGDGFTDLVVGTDPPYDGVGRPPVPLQILFGSPGGLTGRAVTLRIPDRARFGNEWPDHPVCGDFDGDGKPDLAVTASEGRFSFLRGPFTRDGRPHAAGGTVPGAGAYLFAPEPRADLDGDGYDDLVYAARPHTPHTAGRAELLRGTPDGPTRPGGAYRFPAPPAPLPTAPLRTGAGKAPAHAETTLLERYGDFDGDRKPDLVVRTHRGETADLIALYPAATPERPLITFTSALFTAD